MSHTTPDDAKEQPMNELKTLANIRDYINNSLSNEQLELLVDLAFVMGEKHQLEQQLNSKQ